MAELETLGRVFFDLDGTLAGTLSVCCAAYRQAFAALGHTRYSDEELSTYFGPNE